LLTILSLLDESHRRNILQVFHLICAKTVLIFI